MTPCFVIPAKAGIQGENRTQRHRGTEEFRSSLNQFLLFPLCLCASVFCFEGAHA